VLIRIHSRRVFDLEKWNFSALKSGEREKEEEERKAEIFFYLIIFL